MKSITARLTTHVALGYAARFPSLEVLLMIPIHTRHTWINESPAATAFGSELTSSGCKGVVLESW